MDQGSALLHLFFVKKTLLSKMCPISIPEAARPEWAAEAVDTHTLTQILATCSVADLVTSSKIFLVALSILIGGNMFAQTSSESGAVERISPVMRLGL